MTVQPEAMTFVPGEEVLRRKARSLIGWLADQEAISVLLGRTPKPGDDVGPLLARVNACRKAVAEMPRPRLQTPLVDQPFAGLDAVRSRPDVASTFGQLNWRPAVVDLRRVLSFQKIIHIDGLEERTAQVESGAAEALLELCIPQQQHLPPVGAFTDPDGKGFTVSSFNPNLRIAGGQISEANVSQSPGLPPMKMQAITLLVYMGASYLQVVRYKDRSFIRDGYHRAAALLRRGIYEVPCIFIEANAFEEVGTPVGSFTYEVLYGDRPPRLTDFWDESVSAAVDQVAVRKVVRIRGEEFVVPR